MKNKPHLYDLFDSELCLIGAADNTALTAEVKRVINFLEHAIDIPLKDVAYTCAHHAKGQPSILAAVATTIPELRDRLILAHRKLEEGAKRVRDRGGVYFFRQPMYPSGKIALLFPGAPSFYPDMLRDLTLVFDECRTTFDELEAALKLSDQTSMAPSDFIFPPTTATRTAARTLPGNAFSESLIAAHAANVAIFNLLKQLGIKPQGVAGFSGGDFAALAVANVFGPLSRNRRIRFMREGYEMLNHLIERDDLPTCAMLTVVDAPQELLDGLAQRYPGRFTTFISHSPRQQTIALSPDVQDDIIRILSEHSVKTVTVPLDRPFNTPWCAKVLPYIEQFLARWIRYTPQIPIYSCATASQLPKRPRDILTATTAQWTAPIQFDNTINQMYADDYRIFIEVGARGNMASAIRETLKVRPHQAVAINRLHRSGLSQLHHALGILAANGVPIDLTQLHRQRNSRLLDLERAHISPLHKGNTLRLSAKLSQFKPFDPPEDITTAPTESHRRPLPTLSDHRRLDFGADLPMLVNGDILEEEPGVLLEIAKIITLEDYPFIADYSIGTSQLSYSDSSLKGLPVLSLSTGLEIMSEAARRLVPRRRVMQIDNLRAQRWVGFERGAVRLIIRAERISWSDTRYAAVKVQLRDDSPNSAYTWPIIEATVLLGTEGNITHPIQPPPLHNPRPVNWSGHEIYPTRLFHGKGLQIVRHVDLWSEEGIDFEIEVPGRSNYVRSTRIPLFSVWPNLLDGIVSSFSLWRSHEKFAGAVSLPFRARRITFYAASFTEGARLRGYLRLTSVTTHSHVADIYISDGNGNLLLHFKGWEEICERVPPSYQQFILRPSETFLTQELPLSLLGNPKIPVAASVSTDIPFAMFEKNQEIWLKALAYVLLSPGERDDWLEMQGSTNRRVEWLIGRAAAKEATRRYLQRYLQARWTAADIPIWPDESGKPHPIGPWRDHTTTHVDLTIAHTSKLVVAAVVANARIGIDIEAIGRDLSEEFTRGVFTHEEINLAATTGDAPIATLRFWCAKEAISKALGTGIRYSPQDLRVISADHTNGEVEIELFGQWLDAFKQLRGRRHKIHTSIYAGHAFASCIMANSLFDTTE